MWSTFFSGLLVACGPIFLLLLKFFGTKLMDMLGNWLEVKTKSESFGHFIKRIDDAAYKIVKTVYNTYIQAIQKKEGRKLTDAEKANAKKLAMDKLKSYLGPTGLKELLETWEMSDQEGDAYLEDQIEAAIYDAKHGKLSGIGNGSINLAHPMVDAPSPA